MSDIQRKYIWAVERIRKAFPDADVRDGESDLGWSYGVALEQGSKRTATQLEHAERKGAKVFALNDLSDHDQEAWVETMLDTIAADMGVKRADKAPA